MEIIVFRGFRQTIPGGQDQDYDGSDAPRGAIADPVRASPLQSPPDP